MPKALLAAGSNALLFHAQNNEALSHVQIEIPVYILVPVPTLGTNEKIMVHPLVTCPFDIYKH